MRQAYRKMVAFESLERRDLLSGDDMVEYRLALTDTSGQSLPTDANGNPQVAVGQTFRLYGYSRDVRLQATPPSNAKGVFAAYMDVFYTNSDLLTIRYGETQRLQFFPEVGSPAISGTFKLTFDGRQTANITYDGGVDYLAEKVQVALEALPNIGLGNVRVTVEPANPKDPVNADTIRVQFLKALGEQDLPEMTIDPAGLTNYDDVVATQLYPGDDPTNAGTFRTSFTAVSPFINGLRAVDKTALEAGQDPGGRSFGGVGSFLEGFHSPGATAEWPFFSVDLRAVAPGVVEFSGNPSNSDVDPYKETDTLVFPSGSTDTKLIVEPQYQGFVQDINNPLVLNILSDIRVQEAVADGGTSLQVTYAIDGSIPSFDFGFFLSNDPVLDPSDTQIDTATIGDPADRSPGSHTKTFTIGSAAGEIALPGAGVAENDGEYYVLVVADAQDLVEEFDADPIHEDNTAPLTGVYHLQGGDIYVHGTVGDDSLAISSGDSLSVHVNGVSWTYGLATTTGLRARGHSGDDRVTYRAGGGGGAPALQFFFHAGSGANDTALLFDSAGDDRFVSRPEYSYLQGPGFFSYAEGFESVMSYAKVGGVDTAVLFDSAGNDKFISRPDYSYVQGPGYLGYAEGFENVSPYATAGGYDTAVLFDSPGDDLFIGRPDYSYLQGPNYLSYVHGFDEVTAYATAGGTDEVRLFDSAGDDLFVNRPEYAYMRGPGFYNYVQSFDKVLAYAKVSGQDEARLFDSPGDDKFVGKPEYVYLEGPGYLGYAEGFEKVSPYATAGGTDTAVLFDSPGDDKFVGRPDYAYLQGPGYLRYVQGFDEVMAYATAGGTDEVLLFDSAGNDLFVSRPEYAYMSGLGFLNNAQGFDTVSAYAREGGTDEAILFDSAGDDTLHASGSTFTLTTPVQFFYGELFDHVSAYSQQGGTDTLDILAVDYLLEHFGNWI